ncbi:MAG: mandelate racemase/muconate lactonizing enzyme family protein [Rubrivivax sp.]
MAKIVSIEATPVRVKRPERLRMAFAGDRSQAYFGIVVIKDDEGRRGVGEISLGWNGGGAFLCRLVNQLLAPRLMGLSPFDIVRAQQIMDEAIVFSLTTNPAKAAIETAFHDLVGRILNVPVYNLLGGRARNKILVSRSVAIDTLDDMVLASKRYVADGFKALKIKVGRDFAHDIAVARAIRDAVGEKIILRVDANMGWGSCKEALSAVSQMADLGIHSIEQPLPPSHFDDLVLLRKMSPIPIMLDESVWGPEEAYRVIQHGAADMMNVYVSEAGGLRNAMQVFSLGQAAGIPCTIGSMFELGFGTATALHLAAAVPALCEPADTCGVVYNSENLILSELPVVDGYISPPEGPGLGVELDDKRIAEVSLTEKDMIARGAALATRD